MRHDLPPLGWHTFLTTWQLPAGWLIGCVGLLAAYLAGVRRAQLRDGRRPVGRWRITSFVTGVVALAVCLSSGIDAYAMSLFWMHMVEHLTLIMVVPALLVLGHPLTVLRAMRGDAWRAGFDRAVLSWPLSVLTHPLVGMAAYAAVIFATHLTGFMDAMATTPWLMTAEQLAYVGAGWWMLLGLIGEEPIRWHTPYLLRVMLLLIGMVPDTFVGIILLQTDRVPIPTYMAMRPDWATSPLHDLDIGGGLMWALGDGLMMCLGVGLVVSLVSGRTQDRILGSWVERVRTNAFVDHVERSGGQATAGSSRTTGTIDDDEDALDAYNDMLRRLGGSA